MDESMRIMSNGEQSTSFVSQRLIGSLNAVDALVKLESLVEVIGEELSSGSKE